MIFTITTIRHALLTDHRPVGWYTTLERADIEVRHNSCDINECGYYPFAVIEAIPEGIYSYPREEHWYKWNREKDQYEPCEKPDRYKMVQGWSLG